MQDNAQTLEPPAKAGTGNLWMFLIPSLIGLFLFMAPISYDGSLTIPVAVLAKSVQALFGDSLVTVVTAIIAFMSVASVICKVFKPSWVMSRPFLNSLFNPSWLWLTVRVIGGAA